MRSGVNFTLRTSIGDIDLRGEVAGIGNFEDIAGGAETMSLHEMPVRVISLTDLERAKRAAGRAKDLLDLAEIAEIRKRTES